MRSRWLGLAMLLGAGCNEGLFVPPPAVRSLTEGMPGPKGVSEAVGTWAYLVIPAVRIVLDVRGHMLGSPGAPDESGLPVLEVDAEAAALVGVYASHDSLLVLNTSGGFTLEHQEGPNLFRQEGQWALEAGAVVLRASGEVPRRLALASAEERLLAPDATFAPVVAAPQGEQEPMEGELP
jgi:hypothetical protein